MVPAGDPVDETIAKLEPLMQKGDIFIDGGNSNYKDTSAATTPPRPRASSSSTAAPPAASGASRGLLHDGRRRQRSRRAPHAHLRALAPAPDQGWGRVGPSRRRPLRQDGPQRHRVRRHAGLRRGLLHHEGQESPCDLDLDQISQIWRYGSVVRSWLLDLTADALKKNPTLEGLEAYVPDSGEGRWTVIEAIDLNVSAPVITESLIRRLRSREENNFTDRMLSVMRNEFGGHAVKKSE